MTSSRYARITAQIVAAYVSNNHVARGELANVVDQVIGTLGQLSGAAAPAAAPEPQPLVPAVPIRKSIEPDFIICLEDGKRFRSLKRHLATKFGLSPDEYRRKWGLPADYPMVAPNYAAARSQMAKTMGLGRKAATPAEDPADAVSAEVEVEAPAAAAPEPAAEAPAEAPAAAKAPAKRGRPPGKAAKAKAAAKAEAPVEVEVEPEPEPELEPVAEAPAKAPARKRAPRKSKAAA